VRKFLNLNFLCMVFFVLSMLCIVQYAAADVPHYWKNQWMNNDTAIMLAKCFSVIFPLCYVASIVIANLVKQRKISKEDYVGTVKAVSLFHILRGNLSAMSTYFGAGDKYNFILSSPLIFPLNVFVYILLFGLQVLLVIAAAISGGWTMQNIFTDLQHAIILFGGSFFLLLTFILSFFGLFQVKGKKETVRQALVLVAITVCLILLGIYGAVRAELEDPHLNVHIAESYVAKIIAGS